MGYVIGLVIMVIWLNQVGKKLPPKPETKVLEPDDPRPTDGTAWANSVTTTITKIILS